MFFLVGGGGGGYMMCNFVQTYFLGGGEVIMKKYNDPAAPLEKQKSFYSGLTMSQ